MTKEIYLALKECLIEEGYGEEIKWQQNVKPVSHEDDFRDEAIWVILNSGMKEQIARQIWSKIRKAIAQKVDISEVFGHKGKVNAIKYIMEHHGQLFSEYLEAKDKLYFLQQLPYIGKITKYHLAKNYGLDCVKPDRHLVRIAANYGYEDCFTMCKKLSDETGDKVSVVDIVLWRSANLKLI